MRALTTLDVVAMGLNSVIGAGIFLAPASVAQATGAASILVYVLAGALVTLVSLCFAEAGSRFDRAGGPFLYARAAFGPFVGFQAAWFAWLARMTTLAALGDGFSRYVSYLWPGYDSGWRRSLLLCVLIGGLTAINAVGVRQGARTINFFTVAKLAPLLLFVAAGAAFIEPQRLWPESWPASAAVWKATLLLFFVYGGFETMTFPAEEVADPRRSVPRGLLVTQALVILLYLSVHAVTLGTLPGVAQDATPVASAAGVFLGRWGGVLITLGAMVSIAGSQSSTMLATPRLLFALARDGRLPRALSRVHPRYRTPHWAIVSQGAVGLAMALVGTFEGMAVLSAIARMVYYVTTGLAVVALRRSAGPAPFTLPAGPLIPVAAILLCVWVTLSGGSGAEILAGLAAAAVGALLYLPTLRLRHGTPAPSA